MIVSGKILTKKGKADASILHEAPVLAYYFSAHWCPPCRKFTPILAELYNQWNANGKQIEILFVSSDQEEHQFREYFDTMPWTAIPFRDPIIEKLGEKFQVEGIPTLAIVSKDGKEDKLHEDGYGDILSKKEKAIEDWIKLYKA